MRKNSYHLANSDASGKLYAYVPMANFIAEMNGPKAEALIHDLSDIEHSIIYVTPNNVSGRDVGGTLTDYAKQLLHDKVYEHCDYVVNYIGKPGHENRIFRSSTYFIKEKGSLIGLLCVNIDITDQINALGILEDALLVDIRGGDPKETFILSTKDLIRKVIEKRKKKTGKNFTLAERRAIISELLDLGVFKVKGTVPMVANLLNISTQTTYRYIKETEIIREEGAECSN